MALASGLVAFAGGVYYVSMNKLKQTDDLSELEVGKVNAHQSGLKLDRSPGPVEPAAFLPPPAPAAPSKQTGWRRVVFFWRS